MIARSAMATTAVLGLESFPAFPVAVLVGLPRTPWLPLALVGIAGAWVVVPVVVWMGVRHRSLHLHSRSPIWLRLSWNPHPPLTITSYARAVADDEQSLTERAANWPRKDGDTP